MSRELAKYIDHTQLKPDTTEDKMSQVVREAREYGFASVCINPYWVPYCYAYLHDTDVKVCTVIGFPLGATSTASKVAETNQALKDGATEVDMVMNIGELKSGNDETVQQDIGAVIAAAKEHALTKVIIETSLLENAEKVRACYLAEQAGADYVKTSTGFSGGGAAVSDVQLMRKTVGNAMGVKASGGIRDLSTMTAMIDAGASRIGASAGAAIIDSAEE
ncbi:deoxyribose-phosphate aldolase [Barrientosiimonas marina]|uniref:Deoxyribose-phosphate aldolase n=1 Tax=Lentibacillus kimchii TaxID=1542911 RepID=A0ABW2UZP8_9BACI